ncbi:MAG: tRNA (adenine22-N1)-methyltransferase, partial [Myxococcota bacterium]
EPVVRESVTRLVLQPNGDAGKLRAGLVGLGWGIVDERLLIEGRYVYPTIVAEKIGVTPGYVVEDLVFGPVLRRERSAVFVEMLERKAAYLRRVLGQCGSDVEATVRFQAELAMVEGELACGEHPAL